MTRYYLAPSTKYNALLIAAAVIPALFLIIRVYRADHLEKESYKLTFSLIIAGIISAFLALIEEMLLTKVIDYLLPYNSLVYDLVDNFIVVALSEESSKYLLMKRKTWKSAEFNCQFDGVLYATITSLGFALIENVFYVLEYGFSTATIRAVTSIPGHASFGIFMGVFYALAKKFQIYGKNNLSFLMKLMAIIVPVILHGTYDFLATRPEEIYYYAFLAFIIVMFVIANRLIKVASKRDNYL